VQNISCQPRNGASLLEIPDLAGTTRKPGGKTLLFKYSSPREKPRIALLSFNRGRYRIKLNTSGKVRTNHFNPVI
jgi:hypothetical protein